jgi:ABC-type sugar transport system ATPase subunit
MTTSVAPSQKEALRLVNISKSFPGVQALSDMSFDVNAGEVHAICGENGAGKSTLIKIVSGVYSTDSGKIYVGGKEAAFTNSEESFKNGISVMYQETSLFPAMTILENLYVNHEIMNKFLNIIPFINYAEMKKNAQSIFEKLSVNIDLDRKVKDIGMAQKQIAEIAKALTFKSSILIMDEPTAALTHKEAESLFDIIKTLRREGVAIVYISHRIEEIFAICDRVTVMRDGKLISCCNVKDTNKEKIVKEMVGREIGRYFPKPEVEIGEVMCEVENLSCAGLLKNISINIRKKEIVGLAGLAGAGRTELAQAICGLIHADSGTVKLDGREVRVKSYQKAMESRMVYVSEDRGKYGLILNMSVKENISLPQIKKLSNLLFIDSKKERKLCLESIEKFGIRTPGVEFVTTNLSGGNQQKVSVAKAIALEPKILILDEPTRGVDVSSKAEIHKLIGSLVEEGHSILLISSELPELLGMCDRIYVMRNGGVAGCYVRGEATQEKILALALSDEKESA